MMTVLLGAAIMVTALVILTMAIKMRDKSLAGTGTCDHDHDHDSENHATCVNCTCGKIFDKKKQLQKKEEMRKAKA